ncbi:MAG: LacI family DNA-binding transcriptional regulator [Planctomycetota bacterium]
MGAQCAIDSTRRHAVSIVEVAKTAGLSHSTVSRVINNRPGVSPEAAKAVYRAMEQLGYTPPAKRRGRRPRGQDGITTGNVAVLMVGTDAMFARAPVTAAVFHSLEKSLTERGFNVLVAQVGPELRMPPDVVQGRVDGLLLHGYGPSVEMRERLSHIPSVWVLSQRAMHGYWGDRVTPDNEMIGRMAAERLFRRGHQHVGYMRTRETHLGFRAREEAFTATIAEFGGRATVFADASSSLNAVTRDDPNAHEVQDLVAQFAACAERPTGVFVPRDRLTIGVYRVLRRMGIEPGRDVEVMSCDNEPILEALDPRPTTLDVHPELIGRRAVEQLVWRMGHAAERTRSTIVVEPRLVVGDEPDAAALRALGVEPTELVNRSDESQGDDRLP